MPDRPPARLWTIFARVDLGLLQCVCVCLCLSVCVCLCVCLCFCVCVCVCPLDRQNPVLQSTPPMQDSHVLPQPPPGLAQPVPPPELAAYSHLLTNVSSSSTTHVGTHPVRTASSAKRSASTALAGTHNSIGSNLRTDAGPQTKGSDSSCGQFWATQVQRTRPHCHS